MASLLNNASLLLNPAGSVIAYEEDKIFSVLPTNGDGDFTFTGGNGGTRVNQQGYIEQTPANLGGNSENANVWTYQNTTLISTTDITPIGTSNASKISNGSATSTHRFYPPLYTSNANLTVTYTISQHVKYVDHRWVSLGMGDSTLFRGNLIFDLQNGTINNAFGSNSGVLTDYGSQNVGGGWYRIWLTITYTGGWLGNLISNILYLENTNSVSTNYTGTNTSVLVWGTQTNTGGLKPYQPTTNRLNYPRITYQNGRGALMGELQRTNLLLRSEELNNASWNTIGATISANVGISPNGTTNADEVIGDGTATSVRVIQSFNTTAGQNTLSCFLKSGTVNFASIEFSGFAAITGTTNALFDLANGTTPTLGARIENYGNGWYRCSITAIVDASDLSGNIQFRAVPSTSNTNFPTAGDANGKSILAWGSQVEVGGFATSYIPTTTATVTRPTDKAFKYSATSLIGQSSGTVYFDFTLDNLCDSLQTQQPVLWYMKDGGTGERYVELINGNKLVYIEYNGSVIANIQTSAITPGRHKCAIAYANNDMVFYVDGVQIGTDTSGTPSGFSTVSTQYYNSVFDGQCKVHSLAPYTSRISNTELATLTTVNSGSGGTISYYGPYTIHTFTGSGTFTPSFNGQVEVLVVAGGGAGGSNHDTSTGTAAGGGGAGGVLYLSSFGVSSGAGVIVTIGAGGALSGANSTGKGGNSSFGGFEAVGGGNGGARWIQGSDGGSGGGQGFFPGIGNGIVGQGNDGGTGAGSGTYGYPSGGGGGAGEVGANQDEANGSGKGGDGLPFSISGFSTYYGGGGGGGAGGAGPSYPPGDGGLGGGAKGAVSATSPAPSGIPNTGGGGGGSSNGSYSGGTGGSGIIIVRYLT